MSKYKALKVTLGLAVIFGVAANIVTTVAQAKDTIRAEVQNAYQFPQRENISTLHVMDKLGQRDTLLERAAYALTLPGSMAGAAIGDMYVENMRKTQFNQLPQQALS